MENRWWQIISQHAVNGVLLFFVSAVTSAMVIYAYPRVNEMLQNYSRPEGKPIAINLRNNCSSAVNFVLRDTAVSVIRIAGRKTLTQDFVAIDDFSTVLAVETPGGIMVDARLEAAHRGDGYSEGIGFGTYMTYQYAESLAGIDRAPVIMPEGWASGINIRDLRDHYGLNVIMNAMNVEPGYYKFCVFTSAHSALTERKDLAELIFDSKFGRRNILRFSFEPAARVLLKNSADDRRNCQGPRADKLERNHRCTPSILKQ